MGLFTQLFGDLVAFVYHCFDRIVIHGYLTGLSRPDQVAHFFRQVLGVPVITKEMLSQRTAGYQTWVEAFARNHRIPIRWAEKGVRKEDYVLPWLRRMVKKDAYGVYYSRPPRRALTSFMDSSGCRKIQWPRLAAMPRKLTPRAVVEPSAIFSACSADRKLPELSLIGPYSTQPTPDCRRPGLSQERARSGGPPFVRPRHRRISGPAGTM